MYQHPFIYFFILRYILYIYIQSNFFFNKKKSNICAGGRRVRLEIGRLSVDWTVSSGVGLVVSVDEGVEQGKPVFNYCYISGALPKTYGLDTNFHTSPIYLLYNFDKLLTRSSHSSDQRRFFISLIFNLLFYNFYFVVHAHICTKEKSQNY